MSHSVDFQRLLLYNENHVKQRNENQMVWDYDSGKSKDLKYITNAD